MDHLPPLSLELQHLTPRLIVPGVAAPSATLAVPATPSPIPPLPNSLTLSPTSNYPGPFGNASLGEHLRAGVRLVNTSQTPVRGAKMMVEVQSPQGRHRLGEVIHGAAEREAGTEPSHAESKAWDDLPALEPGEGVEVAGSHEIAEMGQHIFICSVAWETTEGRRTFQRFLKFTVNAPLAIKTRVHTPTHPNASHTHRRGDVYLEVLMQNVSPSAMLFESVVLNPVPGLVARSIGVGEAAAAGVVDLADDESSNDPPSLLPSDTSQRLFVLSPTDDGSYVPVSPPTDAAEVAALETTNSLPLSAFPPNYATGTVLPLGRLDIAWVAGQYRERGRFQTSMLNRRTPAAPIAPLSRPGTPVRQVIGAGALPGSARNSLLRPLPAWDFDLTVFSLRSVAAEDEFTAKLSIAVRSNPVTDESASPPPPLQLGIQLLSPASISPPSVPSFHVRPPSRVGTPTRPASPAPVARSPAPSRPMTPVSAQLRHAAVSNIASPSLSPTPVSSFTPPPPPPATAFPPAPVGGITTKRGAHLPPTGKVVALGASLVAPSPAEWVLTRERAGTTYAAEAPGTTVHRRWEARYEIDVKFLALNEGLAELGGCRVLLMDEGMTGKEWDSLGDVWVVDE